MVRAVLALTALFCLFFSASRGQTIVQNGLVAYYPFSGTFNDASGNGNNGTAINGAAFSVDQWGNANSAAFFDGVDDYVTVLPSQSLVAGKRFSIAFRFKTLNTALQIPVSKADFQPAATAPNNVQYHLAMFAGSVVGNNGLMLGTSHTGNTCYQNSAPVTATHRTFGIVPVVNQWHCVALTFDSGTKKIYIDGLLTGQSAVAGFPNNAAPDSCFGGALRLGCWWQGDPRWFNGTMDEMRIYSRTLSSTEIDSLCNYVPPAPLVINNYAALQSYDSCTNTFAVDDATGFAAGDSVLMIQMKGAVVDSSNTPSFGNILQIGNAGNYEYNAVQSVTGNNIRLVNAMQRSYTIPAGKVQFVRVPHYAAYTVNTPHSAMPWNGSKGGVFAISVAGTLTVDSSIDVSGKGFRGGFQAPYGTGVQNCGITTWSGPIANNLTAEKGEGISEVSAAKMGGRGKLANGGGAGNAHNAGGGGGSNAGAGGLGGSEFSGCNANPGTSVTQGIGGIAMSYSNPLNKVFMGGGGGSAESNNFTQSSGGAGGGIVVIRAGNISSPGSGQLVASGQAAPECVIGPGFSNCSDGMGGGGGGGAILVSTPSIAGALTTKSAGGKGADVAAASGSGQIGPGGGGGGGAFWFSGASIPATVTVLNSAGMNGVINFNGSPWGASPGTAGLSLTGLTLPVAAAPFVTPCVNDTVINAYAAVLGYDSCTNTFTVDSTNNFLAGDTVIVIQMKGVAFDSTNTAAFGTVLAYNNAGNYEYNVVLSKTANTITLRNVLLRTYTIPGGLVQLVKVPSFSNYTTAAPHTARAWNGVKGGVLALNVTNTLTLGHSLRANGKGFGGGQKMLLSVFGCNRTAYFYPPGTNEGSKKGEGPASISVSKSCGRGALVSGGGGGNDHNTGGGGGGNGGGGGRGGFQHPLGGCSPLISDIGGVGGVPLAYTTTNNKIFLGGGGGSGHGNDLAESSGGPGGGMVLVRAGNIVVAGGSISAHGGASPACPGPGPGCSYDGGGGGGAAGAVLIHAGTITGSLSVGANGGAGANAYSGAVPLHKMGPGGGGGGGTVWTAGTALPSAISASVLGGIRGVLPQSGNDTFGAIPGSIGQVLSGLQMPVSTVQFIAAPPVAIQDSILSCRTVLFTATGGTGIATWSFGNGATASGNPVTYTYPAGGTYVASVQYPGCFGSDTETVILPSDPVVTVAGNPAICAGASTPLTAAGASSFAWTPSTGLNTTSGSTVVASPSSNTTYTVTGTAATGCTGSATHTLTVNPIPSVTASSSPGTICEGAGSTLTASTTIPATFSWAPGGATQGTIQVSPTTTTVYTVTASATGCNASDTALVTVLPKPVVSITTPDATVCPQSTATLTASAGTTAGTLLWPAPASGTTATITTPPITAPTNFSVYFLAANGCRDTATQIIGIHTLPTVSVYGPALLCSGTGPASLTAAGAASYAWSPAQYLTATSGATVQSLPPVGTSITYTVTGTDANGCTGTDQHTLSVEPSPVVNAGPDTSVCSGNPFTLFATGTPAITWNPTNSTAAGDSITILETVLSNTTYTYIATGTVGSCSDADTVKLTVRALPAVVTLPKTAYVCRYDSARLVATGAATYAWSPVAGLANPTAAATMAKPDSQTTYTVTGTDAFGCVNRDTARVNVNEALPVKASGDGQPISCDNSLAQLHATGAATYVWSPGEYLNDSTMAHPVATPPATMQFTVIGSNSAGCTGRDTITVVSLRESTLMMPNVFTPNGDGINDRVYPLVYCDFTFRSFSIYNRWGQRVFLGTKLDQGWDGRFQGEAADVGVYIFMVDGVGDKGQPKTLKGNMTLLR